ncbi:MAG: heavy-metal-associated domain-containing protein [Alphaproteobacteria bacterium]
MKKLIIAVGLLSLLAVPAFAETAKVTVNGMVCAFCAVGIKKSFGKLDAVEKVDVDLDSKLVTIKTKDGQTLDDAAIKQVITDAGYDSVTIVRSNP